MLPCKLTQRQAEANRVLASNAKHVMLYGGSRSGKTFLIVRALVIRALKAPRSRHAILRFRFNAVRASVALDTFPKVMALCFPGVKNHVDRSSWYAEFSNGSQVWFGGLDDKDRTEKILGQEFASIFLNECSQIPYDSRNIALTRLAQNVMQDAVEGSGRRPLPLRMYYDQNPPSKNHWSYQLFERGVDPETKEPIRNRGDMASVRVNPRDNAENLPDGYIDSLGAMSARHRRRFLDGEYRDATPGALFSETDIDRWRVLDEALPDMQRIIIAVDPSGAGDTDSETGDAIGICVMGLGVDGVGYLLEDLTLRAAPAVWGKVVATAFDRHGADLVVGEANYGGGMVKHVVQVARPRTPYLPVTATRGKVVRAEPVSALVESGRIRLVGYFRELEEELLGFTTNGYTGELSPNRGDAFVWAATAIFSGVIAGRKGKKPAPNEAELAANAYRQAGLTNEYCGWMGA
jgi:phage terminase large subunit-like protein